MEFLKKYACTVRENFNVVKYLLNIFEQVDHQGIRILSMLMCFPGWHSLSTENALKIIDIDQFISQDRPH